MSLIGAIRNSKRKLTAVALSSPQIPHGMSRLALHLNGLLVETVPAGWRDKLHLKILLVLRRNNTFSFSTFRHFLSTLLFLSLVFFQFINNNTKISIIPVKCVRSQTCVCRTIGWPWHWDASRLFRVELWGGPTGQFLGMANHRGCKMALKYVVCPKSKRSDFSFNYLWDLTEITSYLLRSMTLGKLHSVSNVSSTEHSNTGSHIP